ncbi:MULTISPECIES: penicillin acylase family protein [unclassified Streptomyces]|uniref:penicillin acylase family protein n=1 Tax=unclassified Streptomyces TaxID=2593676 RepID=UPI000DC7B803|nr:MULTISPECIES: penicillin acylase family protein [unclassified Streptomyces]AWZ04972.1 acylase [Streptomyces sp. ICC4]AWZ12439.1 acylase [Streptomyces sp. ICC1]
MLRLLRGHRRTRPLLRRVALIGATLLAATAALPEAAAREQGSGPSGSGPSGGGLSAVIRYTENGIPHILAQDYAHLGFGTGWAQAADQVCVLADGFLTVSGERSRWFGADAAPDGSLSSAVGNLSSDLYFKGVRDSGAVEELLAAPAPAGPGKDVKELMRGWAAGYNAWLAQNKITDPACKGAGWVRPVTVTDVAARGFAVSVLGGQGRAVDGITAAQPPGGAQPPGAAPGAGARAGAGAAGPPAGEVDPAAAAEAAREFFDTTRYDMGSNAVAFAGSTTANGRGLLLGNPHYPWQGGRRFWQSQQTIPGELNVSGGSLLGTAVVNIGFNDKVAWSHTVATGTPVNLHQLVLDPADPTAYLVDGKPEKMIRRQVSVQVSAGAPVTRTQWWTRYGPVVSGLGGSLPLPWTAATAYALNDPNAANLRGSDTALAMGKARSVAGIQDALRRTQGLPWVNTVAADSAGGTLFTQSQVLPRITDELAARCSTPLGRATYPSSGLAVLDGSRADCALGSDADAVQPGVFGPAKAPTLQGAPYAENSNDSAWLANADQPLTGYERIWGNVGTPRSLRTRGAVEDVSAMASRGGLTVADLQEQQFANRAPAGDLAAADAAKACAALPGGKATAGDGAAVDVSAACGVLAAWDHTADTTSRGALLFDRFWRKLTAGTPAKDLWLVPFSAADPVRTPRTLNQAAPGIGRALADTVAELKAAGIALDAPLGDHQFVVRGGRKLPVGGGTEALGVWNKIEAPWNAAAGGYPEVLHGSSHIQAVGWDGGRCPVARTLLTYGQSSNPNSAHYADQTRLFSQERWVKARFCEWDILTSPQLKVVWPRERR